MFGLSESYCSGLLLGTEGLHDRLRIDGGSENTSESTAKAAKCARGALLLFSKLNKISFLMVSKAFTITITAHNYHYK